jgi:hypothetical protein
MGCFFKIVLQFALSGGRKWKHSSVSVCGCNTRVCCWQTGIVSCRQGSDYGGCLVVLWVLVIRSACVLAVGFTRLASNFLKAVSDEVILSSHLLRYRIVSKIFFLGCELRRADNVEVSCYTLIYQQLLNAVRVGRWTSEEVP